LSETYEIYIDESGTFEAFKEFGETDPIRLIGGIVIPPELKEKETELSDRLNALGQKYFQKIAKPTDIHFSDRNALKNPNQIDTMKDDVLGFFREQMPEAKLFFIYDLEKLEENTEPPGAQRYRYMLLKLLNALLFYHPSFEPDASFEINLALRRVPYPMGYDQALADQGYLKLKDKYGKTEFTAITEADLQSITSQFKNSLPFRTERTPYFKIKPYGQWDSPFMAMADGICNTVFNVFRRIKPKDLDGELESTFKDRNRIMFYCPIDYDFPENPLNYYYADKPGEFIAKALQNRISSSSDSQILMPAIDKAAASLENTELPEQISNILMLGDEILRASLFYKLDDVKRLIGFAERRLNKISTKNEEKVWAAVLYLYHDVAIRYCNHTANVSDAMKHRDEGVRIFKQYLGKSTETIRNFHEFLNRASVTDTNEFSFRTAIERLEPIMQAEENISRSLLFPGEEDIGAIKNETLGKIYGSIAQNYAFIKDYVKAADYFAKAGRQLGMNNSQQVAYRAHLALVRSQWQAYENEMKRLFRLSTDSPFPGIENLVERALMELPKSEWTLHPLIKGLLAFYGKEAETQRKLAIQIFRGIENHYLNHSAEKHPWEMIFICLGILLHETGTAESAHTCWDAAIRFTDDPNKLTFIMLAHSARAWKAFSYLIYNNLSPARELLKEIADTFHYLKKSGHAPGIFDPTESGNGWFDAIGSEMMAANIDSLGHADMKELFNKFIQRYTFNYF